MCAEIQIKAPIFPSENCSPALNTSDQGGPEMGDEVPVEGASSNSNNVENEFLGFGNEELTTAMHHQSPHAQSQILSNESSKPASDRQINQRSSPSNSHQSQSKNKRRVRVYTEECEGPYIVYIRASTIKLMPLAFQKHLNSRYKVKSATVNNFKMTVVLENRDHANLLVVDPAFKMYDVFIPAELVEIDGAISMRDLCDLDEMEDLIEYGQGKFMNAWLPDTKIVDAIRLSRESKEDPGQREVTDTIKVSFAGRVLPKYVSIGGLLVNVRPFHQNPMHCANCQLFGHTHKVCIRKPKCAQCSGKHSTTSCPTPSQLCPFCHTNHAPGKGNCPYFQEVTQGYRIKQSLGRKSRKEKAIATARQVTQLNEVNDFPVLQNRYAELEDSSIGNTEPIPSISNTAQPAHPHPSTNLPRNPYANYTKTTKRRTRSPHNTNAPMKRSKTYDEPHIAEPTPSVPIWPRPPSNPQAHSKTMSAESLKLLILSTVRNIGISPLWLSVLEAIIDPLMQLLLPLIPQIIGTLITSTSRPNNV